MSWPGLVFRLGKRALPQDGRDPVVWEQVRGWPLVFWRGYVVVSVNGAEVEWQPNPYTDYIFPVEDFGVLPWCVAGDICFVAAVMLLTGVLAELSLKWCQGGRWGRRITPERNWNRWGQTDDAGTGHHQGGRERGLTLRG